MSQTLYELELAHRHIEELASSTHRTARLQTRERPGILRALSQGLGRAMIRAGQALVGGESAPPVHFGNRQPAARSS